MDQIRSRLNFGESGLAHLLLAGNDIRAAVCALSRALWIFIWNRAGNTWRAGWGLGADVIHVTQLLTPAAIIGA